MTTTYVFRAVIEIKVEADSKPEAVGYAEEIAGEIESELPTGAIMINADGHAEVKFIRC